jgi:serine protease inhibitor
MLYVLMVCTLHAEWTEPSASTSVSGELSVSSKEVALAEQRFACRLYHRVAAAAIPRDGNVLLSPYGAFESLAMLDLGARGGTSKAIRLALGGMPAGGFSKNLAELRASGFPIVYQFGTLVKDNDDYGVRILEKPGNGSAKSGGLEQGDLIFTLDGVPVRSVARFHKECADSLLGMVILSGFDLSTGLPITDRQVRLQRVRQVESQPKERVLCFANGLWFRRNLLQDDKFPELLQKQYSAKVFPTDFSKPDEVASEAQRYFAQVTGGRLPTFELPAINAADTAMYLVNVLTLDAAWPEPFEKAGTAKFLSPSGPIKAEYMRNKRLRCRRADFDSFAVIELPYRNCDLAIRLFLPKDPNGWRDLESKNWVAPEFWGPLHQAVREEQVDVLLPKFRVAFRGSLKAPLCDLALEDLFTSRADFSGISAANLRVGELRQQVFVEIDEFGTRAGASTETGIAVSSLNGKPFHATHPFLFAIVDSQGTVYFAGRLTTPTNDPITTIHGQP